MNTITERIMEIAKAGDEDRLNDELNRLVEVTKIKMAIRLAEEGTPVEYIAIAAKVDENIVKGWILNSDLDSLEQSYNSVR